MKVNIFIPKYMKDFKCIAGCCKDTCCAGWDINIDENTFNNYINSDGDFKNLIDKKFSENKQGTDFFNKGLMNLKEGNSCPFLNDKLLCDIHGKFGESKLCITCKSYPRVFNIIDNVYEKSAVPSCEEFCRIAFLSKEKIEFIEDVEDVSEDDIEIRRLIDTESFEEEESLITYFWEIRVLTINIIQDRRFSIEQRLNVLEELYKRIEDAIKNNNFYDIEDIIENFDDNEMMNASKLKAVVFDKLFLNSLCSENMKHIVKGNGFKELIKEYEVGISTIVKEEYENEEKKLRNYDYIFENYLVNQIFKNLIPFNKSEGIIASLKVLRNEYKLIKAYTIVITKSADKLLDEEVIIRVIQALSKDIEHNRDFLI